MTCDAFRELISARLDGELEPGDHDRLDDHLAGCAACIGYADQASSLQRDVADRRERSIREHAAGDVASLGASFGTDRQTGVDRILTASGLQITLFVIGMSLLIINVNNLVEVGAHVTRHDAIFGAGLGVGMLSVAWRPHRAMGLVPLTSAVATLMLIVASADLMSDRASPLAEAIHLLEFTGLICLWVLSGGVTRLQRRVRARRANVLDVPRRSTVPRWPTA